MSEVKNAAPAAKMVSVTVAPGRTVHHTPHFGKDDAPEAERVYGPGETLAMSPGDARRLRELGFLVDPTGGVRVGGTGPVLRDDEKK